MEKLLEKESQEKVKKNTGVMKDTNFLIRYQDKL